MDELPSLETALAESRKYGGCVLAGVQSFPQLTHLYGVNQSQAILDLFNTKVFFRNTDPNTNQWICKVIGDVETTEPQENLSYGAHTMRDGYPYRTRPAQNRWSCPQKLPPSPILKPSSNCPAIIPLAN